MKKVIRIWDLPLRVFHWLLAITIISGIIFVKQSGSAMVWHAYCGYLALALVLFRIIWGFIGSEHARFSSFVPSPSALFAYVRGNSFGGLGHNPLGALSVLALLFSILLQAFTGLFADDEIAFQGPLSKYVSNDLVALLTSVHRFNRYFIYGLIGLHVLAIIYYQIKKKDLITPMLTGDKKIDTTEQGQEIQMFESKDGLLQRVLGFTILFSLIVLIFISF
jgi:cytochrome b